MRGGWCAVVLVAACGGGEGNVDAPVHPIDRCDPAAPFDPPAPVMGINSDADEAAARLSADETEIYFSRRSTNVWDLWRAKRDASDGPFGTPELLTTVNSVSSDV